MQIREVSQYAIAMIVTSPKLGAFKLKLNLKYFQTETAIKRLLLLWMFPIGSIPTPIGYMEPFAFFQINKDLDRLKL